MAIPEQGGIVTGSHTIDITTNSYNGWSLYMEVTDPGNQGSTGDTNTNKDANLINTTQQSSTTNPYTIASLPEEAVPSLNASGHTLPLEDNTWGIAMPYGGYEDSFSPRDDYTSADQDILKDTKWASPKYLSNTSNPRQYIAARDGKPSALRPDTRTIYYGVRVDNPSTTPAGDYQAGIVYTAIANLPPAPTITTITPNNYTIGSNDPTTITIEGTNLASTYEVWIDLDKDTNTSTNQNINPDPNELCAIDKDSITDTKLTCTIPTPSSTLTINPDTYNLYLRTQANDLATATFTYTTPPAGTVCRNADPNSDCQVDIDDNMIPIYYDGNTENGEAIWKVANPNNPGSWYDYTNKKWANAVTVTKDALDKKKYQNQDIVINNNDVLGYWVYIPRYAYEVQRPNAVDRVVAPQNFNIRFETAEDTKKTPATTCNNLNPTKEEMWNDGTPTSNAGPDNTNIKAKDYRTACVNESKGTITRDYHDTLAKDIPEDNTTTWATHPAFSWLDSEGNGTELNGIWVGKFETTGTKTNPTVKPNQHANINERIGNFYTMAKHIGIYDPNNTGGNDVTLNGTTLYANNGEEWTSLHNLNTTTSHMLKNSEWGAVAYLASSIYGAGIDEETGESNVSINSALSITSADADGDGDGDLSMNGITGCGPKDINRSTGYYSSVTTSTGETIDLPALSSSHIEDPLACGDTAHSYIGNIGVLASTTNNVYGIYDMSGGANEYVMGNLSNSPNKTPITSYFINPTKPPYVDIYLSTDFSFLNKPDWSASTTESDYYNDICTWGNCGGHALHETKRYQSVSGRSQSWGNGYSDFADSISPWSLRGGDASMGSDAGLFNSNIYYSGNSGYDVGFHAVLSP